MAIEPKLPTGYYVYTISVADVVRYIGKGKGLRLYSHMKEVRSRLNRDYRLQNIGSRQRWSCFLRQAVKVDSAMKRVIHHEDAETVFG
jgi:hypothetical protein